MKILLMCLFLLSSIILTAQTNPDSHNKTDNSSNMSLEELNQKGVNSYNNGNYKDAIYWFEKIVEKAKKTIGREHPNYATFLNNLALLYENQGLNAKAEPLYLEAKSIYEKVLGKEHPSYATSLNNLAGLYNSQGLYAKAEQLYLEAKATDEKVLGKEHPSYAISLNNLASLYESQGLFAKAEPLYLEAKAIREKVLGKEHPSYATSLNNLAFLYKSQGLYSKAEPLYLEAIAICEKVLGKEHPSYATFLNNIAGFYEDQGLSAKAEPLYFEVKAIREKVLGKKHPSYATSLNNLAHLYVNQGLNAKAEPLYLEAKSIYEKVLGKEHPDYATSLNNLAGLYDNQGLYAKAEPLYLEAKVIREKVLGKKHPSYATSLNNLAGLYKDQGLYTKAEPLYLEAKAIYEKVLGKEHPDYALSLNNLAHIYDNQGLYAKAEPLYLEAKVIREKVLGKEHPDYATSLNNLAGLYKDQGLYAKAEPLFLESKAIDEKVLGKEHPSYATSLNNLASLYEDQGLYAKAEPLFLEAKVIREKVLGKEHSDYAASLINLAGLYYKQGLYAKAEPLYLEAKAICEKVLGKEHPSYATFLNNLALLYVNQGLNAKAEPLYLEAKAICEKVLGKEHPDYATYLNNLALLYNNQGLYAKAEPLYLEAKAIDEKVLGKEHPRYATSLNNLADLYEDQGQYANAEPYFIEGNKVLLHQTTANFSHLSEKEKGKYLNTFSYKFEIFNSYVLKRMADNPDIISEAYRMALATKGLLFESQQKVKNRVLSSGDSELKSLYDKWKSQQAYLASLYQLTIEQRKQANIDLEAEKEKLNELEKQLSASSELFAQATDHTYYTWQDVQKKLKKNEAAIEITRFTYYDKQWTDSVVYMAMIVTPTTANNPEVVVLGNGNALESKHLKYYKNSIKHHVEDNQSYSHYWSKIKEKLNGVKRVYLSADGVYHSLSLDGLLHPETGKFLSDEIDIRLVASTRDLVKYRRRRNPNKDIKLLGYPTYNAVKGTPSSNNDERGMLVKALEDVPQSRFFDGSHIPELPGTHVEVKKLKKIFEKSNFAVSLYTEDRATEVAIKSWVNPRIAHIATHGYFIKDADLDKQQAKFGGISKYELWDNPLLRSGLLLANARQAITSGGEGILTAYEAKSLHLDETELVVLSACETGLGEVKNGEGVYGLQRSFLSAGVATVLMSLWTVSDKATQQLMTYFYENYITHNQSKRQAFRNAQNKLRKQHPHPYYWAAFVMVGE